MKDIVTAEDVRDVPPGGEISASPGAIVTAWAREIAASRGVRIVHAPPAETSLAVAVGSDHGGLELKEQVKSHLTRLGYRFHDFGTHTPEPVDYPDIALAVAKAVQAGDARIGILVDGAGIGSAMAANKVPGVRAALCVDGAAARPAPVTRPLAAAAPTAWAACSATAPPASASRRGRTSTRATSPAASITRCSSPRPPASRSRPCAARHASTPSPPFASTPPGSLSARACFTARRRRSAPWWASRSVPPSPR